MFETEKEQDLFTLFINKHGKTLKSSVHDNLHWVSWVGNGFMPKLLLPTHNIIL